MCQCRDSYRHGIKMFQQIRKTYTLKEFGLTANMSLSVTLVSLSINQASIKPHKETSSVFKHFPSQLLSSNYFLWETLQASNFCSILQDKIFCSWNIHPWQVVARLQTDIIVRSIPWWQGTSLSLHGTFVARNALSPASPRWSARLHSTPLWS